MNDHPVARVGRITLIPDRVYTSAEAPAFVRIAAPTHAELQALVELIGARLGRHLGRPSDLSRDVETSYLTLEPSSEEDTLADLQGH